MTSNLGIGIDTARYGHHVSFLDQEKRPATKPFHFEEGREGYDKLKKSVEALIAKYPSVQLHIRLDVAGQYAENLIAWLQGNPWPATISVGTPAKNKAYREAHYDKQKADPVESLACARFAVVERPEAMPSLPAEFSSLRATVAALEAEATHRTRLINQPHALLAKGFPELAKYAPDLSKEYCLSLILRYPTASKLASAKLHSVLAISHMKVDLGKTLHAVAKSSTASASNEVHQSLSIAKVREIMASKANSASLLKLLKKAWDSLPEGAYKRVHTIKGIGLQTAAALVAKMLFIERFETDSALIGYFGIFPEERATSGTERDGNAKKSTTFAMSAKGNDLVRRLLYTAAQSAVLHNPAVKALFARQMALGKPYHVALGHCMAKLLRQVFAVWRKNEDYDRDFESRQPAEPETTQEEKKVVGPNVKVVKPHRREVTTTTPNVTASTQPSKRPPLNYTRLKLQVSIGEVLRQYSWKERTGRGSQLRGACPIHQSRPEDKSFAVHTGKNTLCCHSCGKRGNALDLLVELTKQPLHDACWQWIDRVKLEPPLLD